MAPKDDKTTDQAIGHLVRIGFRNPVLVGLIGICIGGPVGNYLGAKNKDPRMDSVMVALNDIRAATGRIKAVEDTVAGLDTRIAKLEDRDRLAYLGTRRRNLGRNFDR